jgi:hypothetical protein
MFNRPLTPIPIKFKLTSNKGTIVVIKATNKRLQTAPTPSLSKIIKYKARESSRLIQELKH